MNKLEKVEIENYIGTWYELERCERNGTTYYFMESELFGDDADALITTIKDGKHELVSYGVWDEWTVCLDEIIA